MIIDNYLDRKIGEKLLAENEEERKNHVSSGKLTASMLGQPLQWQILKVMGVPQKPFDEYTLRKFKRGKDIEDWFVKEADAVETQKDALYRDVVGFIDLIADTRDWDFPSGIIPVEVKSVTNAKFKRITGHGEPDRSHLLQACLYALSEGTDKFGVTYIAADDLRVVTSIHETADYKVEVDRIIDRFQTQLATGKVPAFVAEEKWQADLKYCNYPEWLELDEKGIEAKLLEFKF